MDADVLAEGESFCEISQSCLRRMTSASFSVVVFCSVNIVEEGGCLDLESLANGT